MASGQEAVPRVESTGPDQTRPLKLIPMGAPAAMTFHGPDATLFIKWYRQFSKLGGLPDQQAIECLPFYCTPDVAETVRALISTVTPAGSVVPTWDALETEFKREFYDQDPKQYMNPRQEFENWFSRPIGPHYSNVQAAIKELDRLMTDVNEDPSQSRYTDRFFLHLPAHLQKEYHMRYNVKITDVGTRPYAHVRDEIRDILYEEQARRRHDETEARYHRERTGTEMAYAELPRALQGYDQTRPQTVQFREPVLKAETLLPKTILKRTPTPLNHAASMDDLTAAVETLKIQHQEARNEMEQQREVYATKFDQIRRLLPTSSNQQQVQVDYLPAPQHGDLPQTYNSMVQRYQGGRYQNQYNQGQGYQAGYQGQNRLYRPDESRSGYAMTDFRCHYCGTRGHRLLTCDKFLLDSGHGLCHFDQSDRRLVIGKFGDQLAWPISRDLYLKFKDTGEVRNVVWAHLEKWGGLPGSNGMKELRKKGFEVPISMKYLSLSDGDDSPILRSEQGLPAILANNRVTEVLSTSWNQVTDEGYVPQKQMDFRSYLAEVKGPSPRVVTLTEEEDEESIFDIMTAEADGDVTMEDGDPGSSRSRPRTSDQTETRRSKRLRKDADAAEAEEPSDEPAEPAEPPAPAPPPRKGKSKAPATASGKEPTRIGPPAVPTDSEIEKDIAKELIRKITEKVLNAEVKVSIASLAQLNPQIALMMLAQLRNTAENVTKTVQIEGDKTALSSNAQEVDPTPSTKPEGSADNSWALITQQMPQAYQEGPIPVERKPLGISDFTPKRVAELGRVTCSVGGDNEENRTAAVLDTGSQTNTMSFEYAERCNLPIRPTKARSKSYHGSEVAFQGECVTTLWIGGYWIKIHCFVMPPGTAAEDLLLGLPFILDANVAIEKNAERKKVRLNMLFRDVRLVINTNISTEDQAPYKLQEN